MTTIPANHTTTTGDTMTAYRDRLLAGHYNAPPSADELEEATVADLKQQLSDRGLPVSGNKDELIARLANADDQSSE